MLGSVMHSGQALLTHERLSWRAPGARLGSVWPAVWRFVGLWLIISLFAGIYRFHPYYRGPFFEALQPVVTNGYVFFCGYGFFYVWLTYRWRRRVRDDFSDPALLALSLVRHCWKTLRFRTWSPWTRYWKSQRVHLLLRALGVKLFFVPLMVVFLSGHVAQVSHLWDQPVLEGGNLERIDWGVSLLYHLIFVCDTVVALVGYSFESLWLNNRTRSVDRTWLGWAVCLMCYPPFSEVADVYFPLSEQGQSLGLGESSLLFLRGLTIVFFAVYLWATLALGVRFSNLSNKGIIAYGPYRWVRHPAYVCKNLAWWLEKLPTMANFHNVLPLLAWNAVYILRGLTEERHLQNDPAYRDYCKKVRYRFIPGVW
jgi:hypothetical protein